MSFSNQRKPLDIFVSSGTVPANFTEYILFPLMISFDINQTVLLKCEALVLISLNYSFPQFILYNFIMLKDILSYCVNSQYLLFI
jgi:hypothetical protein